MGGAGVSSQRCRFRAGGQLGMLSSLSISSPCCWSVCCPRLLHWSPSLPASPVLRGTRSQCRGERMGGRRVFSPSAAHSEKETTFPVCCTELMKCSGARGGKKKKTTQRRLRSVAQTVAPKQATVSVPRSTSWSQWKLTPAFKAVGTNTEVLGLIPTVPRAGTGAAVGFLWVFSFPSLPW